MNEGVVASYQHFTKRLSVLVEVNCETDFVAKTDKFQQFAYDIALHIANMNPRYVSEEDIPEAERACRTQPAAAHPGRGRQARQQATRHPRAHRRRASGEMV